MEGPNEPEDQIFIQIRCKLSNQVALRLLIRVRDGMGTEILSEDLKEMVAQERFSSKSANHPIDVIGRSLR